MMRLNIAYGILDTLSRSTVLPSPQIHNNERFFIINLTLRVRDSPSNQVQKTIEFYENADFIVVLW